MPQEPVDQVIPRVMGNQMLFQAGNSLTTGSFFNYFVAGFHPSPFWLAVLMIIPETVQSLSALTRRLFVQRKKTWIIGLLIGRGAALLIPCSLLFPVSEQEHLPAILFLVACTLVWYLAQGIAYVNYLSWLSDLSPKSRWGVLFSRRQIAGLLIGVGMPLGTLFLRKQILAPLPDSAERWSYAVLFAIGGILSIASLFPLLALPDRPLADAATMAEKSGQRPWREIWRNSSFRCLLATRWTAAFFQGLTQSVLFKYAYDILKIPIEFYLSLISLMLILQIPLSWVAGRVSDQNRDRSGLFFGLLFASGAMPCWLLADEKNWGWLIVAYSLWSAFALVNVCGTNLCLKLSPRGENLRQLALYEQCSGLIAGLAGLLGGILLQLLLQFAGEATDRLAAFQLLILVSWIGRIAAPFWLLLMPRRNDPSQTTAPASL